MTVGAAPAPRLPAALAPWAAELAIFPHEIALSLGPLLRRLGAALGPLRRLRHAGDGDVDGFDGLARRGPYERLLVTEWLLADEAPDEFLRRAANGEHTFLRLARPEPDGERVSHVLFDAGPAQLGSPRIAHIAALVVLSRRAAEAGAHFSWGVLQQPAAEPFTDVTPSSVQHLLAARTASEATSADLRTWRERVGEPVAADDLWLVGGRRLDALDGATRAMRLFVEDRLDPEKRELSAEVWSGHRRLSSVMLELPDDAMGTRLLRDPFGVSESSTLSPVLPTAPSPASNLVFADNGLRLFARAPNGVVDYPVPNSPRARPGNARNHVVPTSRAVIAAGRAGRGFAFVTAGQTGWNVHVRRGSVQPGSYLLATEHGRVPGVGTLAPCHVQRRATGFSPLVFRHGPFLIRVGNARAAGVLSADVMATCGTRDAVLFVERVAGRARLVHLGLERATADLGIGEQAWFGFGGPAADPLFGLVALAENSGKVHVRHAHGTSVIRVPSDLRAMGVTRNLHRGGEPGIVVLEGDGRTVIVVGQSWTRRLPRASAPIETLVVSSGTACVAWTTTQNELAVFSLDHDVELLRLRLVR